LSSLPDPLDSDVTLAAPAAAGGKTSRLQQAPLSSVRFTVIDADADVMSTMATPSLDSSDEDKSTSMSSANLNN